MTIRASRGRWSDGREGEAKSRSTNYARFEHSLTLAKGVKTDQSNARYQHGVLELTIPASPELMGRKISVEIGKEDRAKIEHQAA